MKVFTEVIRVLVEVESANSGFEIVVLKVRQLFKARQDDKNSG
jgi:hypothetical protein